ncbi:hypothetical protein, partial [Pseudomonas syringae group genomosp. 3]|uniref:hypothetical protein n=1 Tax=Pseudomonas syringae group genomosp. 3 TaxID=251701 RepID=UPI001C7E5EEB
LRSSVGRPFLTLRVIFLHRSRHMKNPSLCRYHAASLAIQGLWANDHFLISREPEQAIYLGS